MRNIIIALCSAALMLASPVVVQAATFSPDGTYVFTGPVDVKKDLSAWTTCQMDLTITVSGGVATTSANFSGAFPCSGVTFTGSPFATDGLGSPVRFVEISGVTMNVPPGSCQGSIYALWGGNTLVVRAVEFRDAVSDIPGIGGTPPCKLKGVISQNPADPQLIIF